jgi:hypothetical protein
VFFKGGLNIRHEIDKKQASEALRRNTLRAFSTPAIMLAWIDANDSGCSA